MRPKGMEDLAAFSSREVKTAAAEERDEYSSAVLKSTMQLARFHHNCHEVFLWKTFQHSYMKVKSKPWLLPNKTFKSTRPHCQQTLLPIAKGQERL